MVYRRVGIYVTKTSLVDQLPPARADIRTKKSAPQLSRVRFSILRGPEKGP
jgi:hypothetical protein